MGISSCRALFRRVFIAFLAGMPFFIVFLAALLAVLISWVLELLLALVLFVAVFNRLVLLFSSHCHLSSGKEQNFCHSRMVEATKCQAIRCTR